jgi:hypothetical protein
MIIIIFVSVGIILITIILTIKVKRANIRAVFPNKIKEAISNKDYQRALELYSKYKSVNGELEKLSGDDIFTLHYENNQLDRLLKEPLPKEYFFIFTKKLIDTKDYKSAYEMYSKYKSLGGEIEEFSSKEVLTLFSGLNIIDKLPDENLPYTWLLEYAEEFIQEKRIKEALLMLKNSHIILDFKNLDDYRRIINIYEASGMLNEFLSKVCKGELF